MFYLVFHSFFLYTANKIKKEGAKAIGEALKYNTSIKKLDLACTTIIYSFIFRYQT